MERRRRVHDCGLMFIVATLLMGLLFPAISNAQHQPPPPCPESVSHWAEACANATSTRITPESCPDHRVILETSSSLFGSLRIEVASGSRGFRQVRDFSLSPIGSYDDWNAAPENVRRAFERVVQCARGDSRIDAALTEVLTITPPPERPTEYPRVMASPKTAWLWFLPFAFLGMALKTIFAKRIRAITFLFVSGVAFAVRMLSDHHPANWYSDLWGPKNAVSEAFVRRGGGYAGFFQIINEFVPIGPTPIFVFSALCSALAIALLVDLTLPISNENNQRSSLVLPLFCGALLIFDPRMRYLGASDAAHNVAVFSFALTLWFYCDSLSKNRGIPNGLAILLSSMLTGMARPELLAGVAVVPLLATVHHAAKPKRHVFPIICAAIGAGFVLYAWAGKPVGVALEPITTKQIVRWLQGCTPWLLLFPWALLLMDSIRRKSVTPLLLILAYYVAAAPRIPTGYAGGTYLAPMEEVIAAVRYDAISHLILLLSITHGFAALYAIGKNVDAPRLRTALRVMAFAGGFVFAYEWSALTTGGAHRFPNVPSSFQMEYEFLARTLPQLPKNATVATVWSDHFPSRSADPDAGMAWPASLLSYLRPDLKFVAINPNTSAVVPEGSYVFMGAMCSFDVNGLHSFIPPDDVEYMRQFSTLCRQLAHKSSPMDGVSDERREVVDRRFGRNPLELSLRRLQ